MASTLIDAKPLFTKHHDNIHLTYELPHRVYTSTVYPVHAPNGSTILVYGHKNGLSVLWRGGRRFKQKPSSSQMSQPASYQNDGTMVIDLTEDPKERESAAFEPFVDSADASEPYDPIIDALCLELGTDVLHLAIPPLPPDVANRSAEYIPPLFGQKLVVAVACSDSSIRLITIPLTPAPSRLPKQHPTDSQKKDIDIVEIDAPHSGMTKFPRGIALTWSSKTANFSLLDDDMSSKQRHSQSPIWELVVSWISRQGSGTISTAVIPTTINGIDVNFDRSIMREPLPSPAITISFNPSRYPSRRHLHMLLADSKGVVRIYDPLPKRGSIDNTHPDDDELSKNRGAWLTSLYGPFQRSSSGPSIERKPILDAKWALEGQCILVLLSDGQWGVWDLSDIGPSPKGTKPPTPSQTHGVSGGGVTSFALRGFLSARKSSLLGRASTPSDHSKSASENPKSSTNLHPMTPNTRASKQSTLFSGPATTHPALRAALQGGISLSAAPLTEPGQTADDSALLWYGSDVFLLPSLTAYWSRASNSRAAATHPAGGIPTGPPFGPHLPRLAGLTTAGELVTSIAQFAQPRRPALPQQQQQLWHGVLISAEHRILIVSPPRPAPKPAAELARLFRQPGAAEDEDEEVAWDARQDGDLLARRQLGLDGVDRMLDGMANDGTAMDLDAGPAFGGRSNRTRRVGFAVDQ